MASGIPEIDFGSIQSALALVKAATNGSQIQSATEILNGLGKLVRKFPTEQENHPSRLALVNIMEEYLLTEKYSGSEEWVKKYMGDNYEAFRLKRDAEDRKRPDFRATPNTTSYRIFRDIRRLGTIDQQQKLLLEYVKEFKRTSEEDIREFNDMREVLLREWLYVREINAYSRVNERLVHIRNAIKEKIYREVMKQPYKRDIEEEVNNYDFNPLFAEYGFDGSDLEENPFLILKLVGLLDEGFDKELGKARSFGYDLFFNGRGETRKSELSACHNFFLYLEHFFEVSNKDGNFFERINTYFNSNENGIPGKKYQFDKPWYSYGSFLEEELASITPNQDGYYDSLEKFLVYARDSIFYHLRYLDREDIIRDWQVVRVLVFMKFPNSGDQENRNDGKTDYDDEKYPDYFNAVADKKAYLKVKKEMADVIGTSKDAREVEETEDVGALVEEVRDTEESRLAFLERAIAKLKVFEEAGTLGDIEAVGWIEGRDKIAALEANGDKNKIEDLLQKYYLDSEGPNTLALRDSATHAGAHQLILGLDEEEEEEARDTPEKKKAETDLANAIKDGTLFDFLEKTVRVHIDEFDNKDILSTDDPSVKLWIDIRDRAVLAGLGPVGEDSGELEASMLYAYYSYEDVEDKKRLWDVRDKYGFEQDKEEEEEGEEEELVTDDEEDQVLVPIDAETVALPRALVPAEEEYTQADADDCEFYGMSREQAHAFADESRKRARREVVVLDDDEEEDEEEDDEVQIVEGNSTQQEVARLNLLFTNSRGAMGGVKRLFEEVDKLRMEVILEYLRTCPDDFLDVAGPRVWILLRRECERLEGLADLEKRVLEPRIKDAIKNMERYFKIGSREHA